MNRRSDALTHHELRGGPSWTPEQRTRIIGQLLGPMLRPGMNDEEIDEAVAVSVKALRKLERVFRS